MGLGDGRERGVLILQFIVFVCLKWYYDESHIFPIEAILKHKQVACMRNDMLFTVLKYLLVPEIFKFLKYAN